MRMVKKNSINTGVRITYDEFIEFLRLQYCNLIIYDIFNKYVEDKLEYSTTKPNTSSLIPIMTKQQFTQFLRESQKIDK
jgi:hypothetical protein